MKQFKRISRNELKNIYGADAGDKRAPGISVIGVGGEGGNENQGFYKCCWERTEGCSVCFYAANVPSCPSGAYPIGC